MTPSALIAVLAGFAALALFLAAMGAAVFLAYRQPRERPRKLVETPSEPLWAARVAALEVKVDALPGLWEEERRRAEQARDRERYYASKSRKRRDAEDDAEPDGEDLSGGDAETGSAQGVLPLSTNLGSGAVSSEPPHLRRARELGYPWTFLS